MNTEDVLYMLLHRHHKENVMECKNKQCLLYEKCHIKGIAQNCSLHRKCNESEGFSDSLNKAIDTQPIEEVYPEIAIQTRANARKLISEMIKKEEV